MALILNTYPELGKELKSKIGYIDDVFDYEYEKDNELVPLEAKNVFAYASYGKLSTIQLTDPLAQWYPEKMNLIVNAKCVINTPLFLFGQNGLASKNGGILGIAIQWMAKDANCRGIKEIGSVSRSSSAPTVITEKIVFQPHQLRGILTLRTVIFLKEVGSSDDSEFYLANTPGTILGVLDETKVIIEGKGSIFPVVDASDPGSPLWWVNCGWDDPTVDRFSEENFALYLNKSHNDYAFLNVNNGLSSSPLLKEIICSAVQILITKVLNDDVYREDTVNNTNLSEGSVSSVVYYMIKTMDCGTDIKRPEEMAKKIRESLSQRLK